MRSSWLPEGASLRVSGRYRRAMFRTHPGRYGKQRSIRAVQPRSVQMRSALFMNACHPDQHEYIGHSTCDKFYPSQVNLKGPVCGDDGCQKFASFGYAGGLKERCAAHRLDDMVRTAPFRQCGRLSATPQLRKQLVTHCVQWWCCCALRLLACGRSPSWTESPRGAALRRKIAKARKQRALRAARPRDGVGSCSRLSSQGF